MKISSAVLLACAIAVLLSAPSQRCEAQSPASRRQAESNRHASLLVPGFTVKLSLSKKAGETLRSRAETIIVAGYLSGFPRPGTPKHYVNNEGQVWLGQVRREIKPGEVAVFQRIALDRSLLRRLNAQGPQLLINVYSGRRSSPNNLIDCGIYSGSLRAVQNTTIHISCKLIGEQ